MRKPSQSRERDPVLVAAREAGEHAGRSQREVAQREEIGALVLRFRIGEIAAAPSRDAGARVRVRRLQLRRHTACSLVTDRADRLAVAAGASWPKS